MLTRRSLFRRVLAAACVAIAAHFPHAGRPRASRVIEGPEPIVDRMKVTVRWNQNGKHYWKEEMVEVHADGTFDIPDLTANGVATVPFTVDRLEPVFFEPVF